MTILLPQVLPVKQPSEFKLHLACYNQKDEPLDVFVRSRTEWDGWNKWRSARDDFSRDYIFSLIDFYPERETWLFGGAYKVLSRKVAIGAPGYEVELLPDSAPLIGRLKVRLKRPGRAKAFNFEKHYQRIEVAEVLSTPYTGEPFPGYEAIDLTFSKMEAVHAIQRSDWKASLESVKGIYLITDDKTGKRYVGSASGDEGIWSRWACYLKTGHGNNAGLIEVIKREGLEYARQNFRFTLLEYRSMKADNKAITDRETFWKRALLTRGDYGYNQN